MLLDQEDKSVEKLLSLARESSRNARTRLLSNIKDLFLAPDGRLNERERALVTDILRKLIGDVEKPLRRELADLLSHDEAADRDLIRELARDDIDVAWPVLRFSRVLEDEDLIDVVKTRGREHQMAVAVRTGVSEAVGDSLIETGGDDVIVALLRNEDARLSSAAMEYLVSESQRVDQFQEPLVRRADLRPQLAYRMFWWVSAALRQHILERYSIDELRVDEAIEDAARRAMATDDGETGDVVADRAFKLVVAVAERGELTPTFLVRVLRSGRLPVFAAGLAHRTHTPFSVMWRIVLDMGVRELAIVCRCAEFSRQDFLNVILLVRRDQARPEVRKTPEVKSLVEFFDAIGEDKAALVMKHWRRSLDYVRAIEQVSEGLVS